METLIEKSREFRETLNETILSEGLRIPGYEDYSVHKEGFIVSHKKTPKILKQAKCGYNKNYSFVVLCTNGKTKSHYIHREVAKMFIPNEEGKKEVNHKDGDTNNNSYLNLEWVTPKEDSNHAVDSGLTLTGEDYPNAKLTNAQVHEICSMIQSGCDNKEIRTTTGIDPKKLYKIKSRRQWKQISSSYDF